MTLERRGCRGAGQLSRLSAARSTDHRQRHRCGWEPLRKRM